MFAKPEMQHIQSQPALSDHALAVLEKRFLLRDEHGQLAEDPPGLFRRVARAVASIDDLHGDFQGGQSEEIFYDLMTSLRFLPNSPTLMNAGNRRAASSCRSKTRWSRSSARSATPP